ncbi:MAG: hypothetical protein HC914_21340 [Chloroflexaceae bacterium]|nr:hypothetical protein [Chloroflexaceae bacterium]
MSINSNQYTSSARLAQSPTNDAAQSAIQFLLNGGTPADLPAADYGGWGEIVSALCDRHGTEGTPGVLYLFETLARAHPDLAKLISAYAPTPPRTTAAPLASRLAPAPGRAPRHPRARALPD